MEKQQKLSLKEKWEQFNHDRLTKRGLLNGDILPYPDEVFENLRPYNCGGVPASIILFINEMCNGKCYDRALLMTMAFKDCQQVNATVEYLRKPYGEDRAGHSYVETNDFGKDTWVLDTTLGLMYKKKLYDKLEKPNVFKVNSKQDCMDFIVTQEMLANDFEQSKYWLPLILPNIERIVEESQDPITSLYSEKVKKEIAHFKQTINYDAIVAEIQADMRMSPERRDEKFGIVRDEYGNEMSRNGVPNPYYTDPETIDERNAEYEEAMSDPQMREEYFENLMADVSARIESEEAEVRAKASIYLKQVEQNPTTNFYEMPSMSNA